MDFIALRVMHHVHFEKQAVGKNTDQVMMRRPKCSVEDLSWGFGSLDAHTLCDLKKHEMSLTLNRLRFPETFRETHSETLCLIERLEFERFQRHIS